MNISDIAKVRANWMEGFGNDPHLEVILKRDSDLLPWKSFRFSQHGHLFYAEQGGEVRFVFHSPNDHAGFGGAHYAMKMRDDWTPRPLGCSKCRIEDRTVHLYGPWSSSASAVTRAIRPVVSASIMPGKYREAIRNPNYYHRMKRRGRAYEGLFIGTAITLEFAREIIDRFAPHLDLYEGDFGWVPMIRGGEPKNPRRNRKPSRFSEGMSDEQAMVIEL